MACMALPCNFGQTSTSCSNFRNPGVSHTPPQFLLGLGSRQCQPSKGLKFDTPCGNHFVELSRSRGPESRRLQVRCSEAAVSTGAGPVEAQPTSKNVLVAGATGGVGQLVVASLLEKGIKVRALLRNAEKAKALFGDQGTTAFPSKRWDGNNGPEQTDWLAVRNLIDALPSTVEKIILVSSVGVTKSDQLPWNIMNLFGVLKYKKLGEDYLRNSGKTFTIIRPGRLTDGPYTSYDLNTLLKATAGTRRDVIIGQGDKLVGEASRIVVAEACVKALDLDCTNGQTYEISSIEGEGPGKDLDKWKKLFMSAHSTV
ncbi:hypothetical protein AXG93_313s1150 [Marchantia polymorpha subsp. ruderalis]|uniref:NAD(P)-binding domain-containing protein n=1 Tax=Marchantia polymorpha subsp. ruderalis TaxID=1480154 RepID=A0A176VD24_MARPO|nr:hypothetical protein AXG93_313s1150 [Marchantia polymorpha subsp. ruderalis]